MERETGFEPATSTLARSHSTTELLPLALLNFTTAHTIAPNVLKSAATAGPSTHLQSLHRACESRDPQKKRPLGYA